MTTKVKKGDTIRILQDDLAGAEVLEGDVLGVTGRIGTAVFATDAPRNPAVDGWWFCDHREGEGWERVE